MQLRANQFGESEFLLDSESDVRHQQRQAEVIIRPSVPFWREVRFGGLRAAVWS